MTKRSRLAQLGILALAITVTAGLAVSAEAAKKKKPKSTVFDQSKALSLPVPDDVAVGVSVPVTSTFVLGGKFKGKVVGDVNVTFQSTGNVAGAADDLNTFLTAPSGRTVALFDNLGDQSIGPLTLDDDTKAQVCDSATPPCSSPLQTLNRPFAGTASQQDIDDDVGPNGLSSFYGVGMKGTWTLTVFDDASIGQTSIINRFGLKITPAKPITG